MKRVAIKQILFVLFILCVCMSSCEKVAEKYKVDKLISDQKEQDSILLQLVTIVEEHIEPFKKEERYLPKAHEFFKEKMEGYRFLALHKEEDNTYSYFISKPAYGVPELTVGLAGKFKLDDKQRVTDFEESYRLFRLPTKEFDEKSWKVYEAFVEKKDLAPFHKDLNEDPYIEFPNDHVAYDKSKREWYFTKLYK